MAIAENAPLSEKQLRERDEGAQSLAAELAAGYRPFQPWPQPPQDIHRKGNQ
jgi:hypothetical protein